jgi:hypothetical protein
MEKYYDKNGKEIKAGMKIRHDDGEVELVYASEDDLGLNASNENYAGFNPLRREIYPLYQFSMKEWEIVEGE